jgi:uncharacterized coiled-coil DUF342 family protein
MTVSREELHRLVDQLPEAAIKTLEGWLAEYDPVLWALLTAPEDDEPETEEERKAMAEAYEDLKAGRLVSLEEVKRELGR